MIKIRFIATIFLSSLFLLSGCSFFRSSNFQDISSKNRYQKLQQIKKWHFKGALSVTHDGNRDLARFDWVQNYNDYKIVIVGPLNIGSAKIIGDYNHVQLEHSDGELSQAATPQELIYKYFGWKLPVFNIRYWILSLPSPDSKVDAAKFDQYGHLIYLEQAGWQVKYLDFFVGKDGIDLPKTIELATSDLTVKIKILSSL